MNLLTKAYWIAKFITNMNLWFYKNLIWVIISKLESNLFINFQLFHKMISLRSSSLAKEYKILSNQTETSNLMAPNSLLNPSRFTFISISNMCIWAHIIFSSLHFVQRRQKGKTIAHLRGNLSQSTDIRLKVQNLCYNFCKL